MSQHKITINPTALGVIALDAARYEYMIDTGDRAKAQHETLISLINVLHVDYLAASQLAQPLRQVIELWRSGAELAEMGELMLDYLDEYVLDNDR